ncbi:MAG: MFS transporter [Lentilitoribacter sp.]
MQKFFNIYLYAAIAFTFFIWGAMALVVGPLMPETVAAFSLSGTESGMIFIVWSSGFSIGSLGSKYLLDRFKIGAILSGAALLSALFCMFLYLSGDFIQYLTSFLPLGIMGGVSFTAGHTFVGQTFTENRASALGALDVVFSLGNVVSPLLLIVLFSSGFGWKSPFLIASCAFLASAAAYFTLFRSATLSSGQELSDDENKDAQQQTSKRKAEQLPIWVLAVPACFLGAVEWSHNIWFVSYAIDIGLDDNISRVSHAAFLAGMIMIRILTIIIGNRIHNVRLVRTLFAMTLMGNLGIIFATNVELQVLSNVIMGFGMGAMFPVLLARAMDVNPQRSSSFSIAMILGTTVGGQLSSLSIGALSDFYPISHVFIVTTLFVVLLIISFEIFRARTRAALDNIHA